MLMQARIRQWHAIRKTEQLREMAVNSLVLKKFVRKYHAENELEELRRAYQEKLRCTTCLQKFLRQYHAKLEYFKLKEQHEASTGMAKFVRRCVEGG
jgi:hypothetical protein